MAYEMDEQERQAATQGSAPSGAMPTAAPSSPGGSAGGAPTGSGFQNLSAYFGANKDAAAAQADSLAGGLDARASSAVAGGDMDAAEAARADIQAAQSQPGIASLYREDAPPTYTAGQAGLDAYLAGQAGGDRFSKLTSHFGALDRVGLPPAAPPPQPGSLEPGDGVGPKQDEAPDEERQREIEGKRYREAY